MPKSTKKTVLFITIAFNSVVLFSCFIVSFWFLLLTLGYIVLFVISIQGHAAFLSAVEKNNKKMQEYAEKCRQDNKNVEIIKITQKQYEEFHKKGFTIVEGKQPIIYEEANKIR
jgi:ABC-type protease/lipase transport system fused ATPase/permease subunit